MKKLPRRLSVTLRIAAGIYLVGFLVLWLGGGYTIARSGRTRWEGPVGLALADVLDWQPLYGVCQPEYQRPGGEFADWSGGRIGPRCDWVGWAYYPLWLMVKAGKPTYALLDEDHLPFETFDPDQPPKGFEFHPIYKDELTEVFNEASQREKENFD